MKITYVKALLYAYPHVKDFYKAYSYQIHTKAHSSFYDLRPVETISDEIIELTHRKYLLGDIFFAVRDVVKKFDKEDIKLIKLKYFGAELNPPIEKDRTYFRRQNRIVEKAARYFEAIGVGDKYFQEEYLKVDAVRTYLEQVVNNEARVESALRTKLKEAKKKREVEGR